MKTSLSKLYPVTIEGLGNVSLNLHIEADLPVPELVLAVPDNVTEEAIKATDEANAKATEAHQKLVAAAERRVQLALTKFADDAFKKISA